MLHLVQIQRQFHACLERAAEIRKSPPSDQKKHTEDSPGSSKLSVILQETAIDNKTSRCTLCKADLPINQAHPRYSSGIVLPTMALLLPPFLHNYFMLVNLTLGPKFPAFRRVV